MRRYLLLALCAFAYCNSTYAADLYLGQTGQYHQIPPSQDTQELTLIGKSSPTCAKGGDLTLFAVDEFGTGETIPFQVPGNTVFVVKDAVFRGMANSAFAGSTPELDIAQSTPTWSFEKASFLAKAPLTGKIPEEIVGQGSLMSGAAFATGSKLCARLSFNADDGSGWANLSLVSVVVHGTVIDNTRSSGLSW